MPETDNLIKSSYYKLEYGGDEVPTVKDIQIPDMEYEPVYHNDGTKAPRQESKGIPKYGDMVVQRDMRRDQNTILYDEFVEAQETPDTGEIKKDAIIFVKNVADETIWKLKLEGCWVKEYRPPTLNATTSDTLTETFVVSVDYMEQED